MVTDLSVWKVLKKTNAQLSIHRENFHDLLKICENHETFLLLNFCHLRYVSYSIYRISGTFDGDFNTAWRVGDFSS